MATLLPWKILEYAIRKVHENEVGLKFNGTHQLLFCVDDVNLLDDSTITVQENTETLVEASRNIGLEVNAEKIKHMILFLIRLRTKPEHKEL